MQPIPSRTLVPARRQAPGRTVIPSRAPDAAPALVDVPLHAGDGTRLELRRMPIPGPDRPVVLLLHGHTASSEMFLLPETRNLAAVLADRGYEPWLLDWRGSCRLPYNADGARFNFDDVALYDIPAAVEEIRRQAGSRQVFVVAHCIGALALSMSMCAGLVPGLAGVVAQGVFLTPKLPGSALLRLTLGLELFGSRIDHMPTDFRKVGLRSKFTPLFLLAARGRRCPDPTCALLQNNWGMGGSLFVHDNLADTTHDRLAELVGPAPMWILPHIRRVVLANTTVRWSDSDDRYRALPENALDHADRIDAPLLLVSGSENTVWYDSNKLCHEVLSARFPAVDVRYLEIPGYGHLDTFIGRGAALDVFGHIADFFDGHRPPGGV